MNTIINTNVSALNSHRAILTVGGRQARSAERLSSGMRINRAADDAAGLAVSEKMRNQIRGLDQATRNSQDGISLVQTAEGALEEIHRILERARELTNQAANDVYTSTDRLLIWEEVNQIMLEIDQIAANTEFNTMNILLGEGGSVIRPGAVGEDYSVNANTSNALALQIQSGANALQRLNVRISAMSLAGLGLENFSSSFSAYAAETRVEVGGISLSNLLGASISGTLTANTLDNAINIVSQQRAQLGAIQNRLEHTINNLRVASENLSASNARIRDTDMAREMMAYTQANVLQQAGMSMLAQANMQPMNILQLLG